MLVGQRAGIAQIGQDTATDSDIAMTTAAVALVQLFALLDRGGACGCAWRREDLWLHLWRRRQTGLSPQFERQHAWNVVQPRRLQSDFPRGERQDAAPADENRDVLFAIHGIGDGTGGDPALRRCGPDFFSRVRAESLELAVASTLEN